MGGHVQDQGYLCRKMEGLRFCAEETSTQMDTVSAASGT